MSADPEGCFADPEECFADPEGCFADPEECFADTEGFLTKNLVRKKKFRLLTQQKNKNEWPKTPPERACQKTP